MRANCAVKRFKFDVGFMLRRETPFPAAAQFSIIPVCASEHRAYRFVTMDEPSHANFTPFMLPTLSPWGKPGEI